MSKSTEIDCEAMTIRARRPSVGSERSRSQAKWSARRSGCRSATVRSGPAWRKARRLSTAAAAVRTAAQTTTSSEPILSDSRPVSKPPATEPAVVVAMMMPFQRLPSSVENRLLMKAQDCSTISTMYAWAKM